ncbi:MAG: DUF494 family protein [Bdellovibrionota bacterium]
MAKMNHPDVAKSAVDSLLCSSTLKQDFEKTTWWAVVEYLSDLVIREDLDIWDENYIFTSLKEANFSNGDIDKAINWVHDASMIGRIQDTLGFIQERNISRTRMENPSESAFLSAELWKRLNGLRMRGVITLGVMEKVLAALRSVDSRDWADDEISDFVDSILMKELDTCVMNFEDYPEYQDDYRPYC